MINVDNLQDDLVVSGTIANGTGQTFTLTLNTTAPNNFNDIYALNKATTAKTQITSGTSLNNVYQPASSELVQNTVTFTPSSIIFTIQISNNTGAPVTLIPQTFTIQVVQYNLPA